MMLVVPVAYMTDDTACITAHILHGGISPEGATGSGFGKKPVLECCLDGNGVVMARDFTHCAGAIGLFHMWH